MPEQGESCHVRAGVNLVARQNLCRILVQGCHRTDRLIHTGRVGGLHTACCADDTGSKWLRQEQAVARACANIGQDTRRVNEPGHRQTVLDIVVVDRVSAAQRRAGFCNLLRASLHDSSQDVQIPGLREADDVQRRHRPTAHRPDVRHRIGCRDLTKQVRVIHHRREEIKCLDDRPVLAHAVDRCIIICIKADQKVRISFLSRQTAQHPVQNVRPELRCAAPALAEFNLLHAGILQVPPPALRPFVDFMFMGR